MHYESNTINGYYLHFNARDTIGVSKKIDMQLAEFRKHFNIDEINIKIRNKGFIRNAFAILPWISIDWDFSEAYRKISVPDFLYIRGLPAEYIAVKFLKYIRNTWPQCKIMVEIPTWPFFRGGAKSIQGKALFLKNLFNYFLVFPKLIDRYVAYTKETEIMGVPVIATMNGIEVDKVVPISTKRDYNKEELNIIAVARLVYYHGYDRLIRGIGEYYKGGD